MTLAVWQRSLLGAPLFLADEIAAREEAQTLSLSAVVTEVLATRDLVSETGAL